MQEDKEKNELELLKSVRKVIRGYPKESTYAYYSWDNKSTSGICHSMLTPNRMPKNFTYFSSIYSPTNKNFHGYFWTWLIDQNKSPWRIVTRDIELVLGPDDLPRGWILHKDIFDEVDFNFIKNFAILTRSVSEYESFRLGFVSLCDAGLDPRDAYILAKASSYMSGYFYNSVDLSKNNGGHWPLTISTANTGSKINFDWDKYWNGVISGKVGHEEINSFFKKKDDKILNLSFTVKGEHEEIGTRFSTIKVCTREDLIESYLNWKKENGITHEN